MDYEARFLWAPKYSFVHLQYDKVKYHRRQKEYGKQLILLFPYAQCRLQQVIFRDVLFES